MGEPATTGQLRANIQDMEIGDYIVWGSNGTSYYFSDEPVGTERPVSGETSSSMPYANTYWYAIKVAKGLLISDRVIEHTVSWDSLNSSKRIQGTPIHGGNIVPTMTSNTSPSGVASASSEYGIGYEAHRALDNNSSYKWRSAFTSGWLEYDFQNIQRIAAYSLGSTSSPSYMAKDWAFEGWDGDQWVILDKQFNQTWSSLQVKRFELKNTHSYSKYRVNVVSNNGGTSLDINSLEMYDTVGTIRSLTGGVAYADEQKNKSLTDQGYGSWPTINEWDRYIVNFPQELIQEGKTLEDVFHWNDCATWTQDTPTTGFDSGYSSSKANNYDRMIRPHTGKGRKDIDFSTWGSSGGSYSYVGFRPVFEYKE